MRSTEAQETQPEEVSEAVFIRLVRMLPLLWLVGIVVLAGYVCIRNISLWLTVKRERPITNQNILDLLEDCKMQMGVQTILGVVVSDRIKSPALFGFIRPRLLLPQGMLETYGLEELRYVFIHELAHLKQRDIYLGWLMALLQIAHWFNPLMWFAFGRIRADRELACDGLAISTIEADESPKYGRTIVNLVESFSQVSYLPSVAGILEDTCQIERRIKMIADYKKTSRSRWAGAMLLLAVLACVVLTNAYVAKADFILGSLENLGPVINNSGDVQECDFSHDGLELYFSAARSDGYGRTDIWVSKRETLNSPWQEPVNLGPVVNSSVREVEPAISPDGLELYFRLWDDWNLRVCTRPSKDDPWSSPVKVGPPVGSNEPDPPEGSNDVWEPDISADGLSLYFCSTRVGGHGGGDIWVATRATTDDEWGEPVNLGPNVNGPGDDNGPSISNDGLALVFYRFGPARFFLTTRKSIYDDWGPAVDLGINNPWTIYGPALSPDGSTIYFDANSKGDGYGDNDIWQVKILPVVDFNADGIVDSADVCLMVDHWLTDEPLYDIAPLPYGDGIVDVKDLVLLAEHLTIEVDDPNLP
jgi:beta-lactamase regulating signal transducer with metallopeptidase domain